MPPCTVSFAPASPARRARAVCILAEPGAVALLVYAITRLLPPQVARAIAFSTYEPPHTSLRDNKVARVIGSFARNGIERADSDALRRRAYVVDTFRDAYGPELAVDASWPLEGLLNLVAEGNWTAVDEIRELWSHDPQAATAATPESLAAAIRVRPLAAALKAGTIDAEKLMELRRNRFGQGLLESAELRQRAWEVVQKAWTRPRVKEEFAELLREHSTELLAEVRGQVESGPPLAWRQGWAALEPLIPAERRAACLSGLLEAAGASPAAPSYSPEERVGLLRDWSQSAPSGAAIPAPLYWLLRAPTRRPFARWSSRTAWIRATRAWLPASWPRASPASRPTSPRSRTCPTTSFAHSSPSSSASRAARM